MARHTYRHFKALMRKNLINWTRQPVCAVFEILSPILLMATIAVIRHYVPYQRTDSQGMLDQQQVSMPGLGWAEDGKWIGSTDGDESVNIRENTFFSYVNYTTNAKPPLPGQPQSN